jgi:hypothetical protein
MVTLLQQISLTNQTLHMKKPSLITTGLSCILIVVSCNNSDLHTKASTDSAMRNNDSISTPVSPSEKKDGVCCFSTMDEVYQFFPTGGPDMQPSGDDYSGDLVCKNDAETQSSVSRSYASGNGKLTLRISDYCINPKRVELDLERRQKNTINLYGKDKEVKDLADAHGLYHGFAVFSAAAKNNYLHVVVDGRFSVTIAGTNQDNFSDIFKLFALIPMDKLAAFKR